MEKEFNNGVDSMCAELMGADGYNAVESFFIKKPVDYDTSVRMWDEVIVKIGKKLKKTK
jgi:hypothetical protein